MKIERGIIGYNNRNEMIVSSVGHIYHLNKEYFLGKSLKENDKVLGVIVDNRFSICREFISIDGWFVFGFITDVVSSNQVQIQTINKVDSHNFDPYFSDYMLGERAVVKFG